MDGETDGETDGEAETKYETGIIWSIYTRLVLISNSHQVSCFQQTLIYIGCCAPQ